MRRNRVKEGKKWKRNKYHDEAVDRIAENPEVLKIEGLNLETLVHKPIKFPELKKKGQETGDLILIWAPSAKEWEILVTEVTTYDFRRTTDELTKLKRTSKYLKNQWGEWFKSIGLDLPENHSLQIRIVSLSYRGGAIWEEPFKIEEIQKIL